jgi:hypothetical protein
MTTTRSLSEAEEAVAEQRRRIPAEGQRHRPQLAEALSELARAYEREDRMQDALAAARESVATLSPDFLQNPRRLSAPMRALVTQYVALAQRCRAQPDEALLTPIAQATGDITRAEDDADD